MTNDHNFDIRTNIKRTNDLPIYLTLLGMPKLPGLACVYTLAIAFLLVSTLPVFSGKKLGNRVIEYLLGPGARKGVRGAAGPATATAAVSVPGVAA